MDLNKYKELTGLEVSASNEARTTATIRRTKSQLETMLGYTLKPKNLYTEKGKAQVEWITPTIDTDTLLPPDEESGSYKLFTYNEDDKYFHVDPFENVYKVKLVVPLADGEFVTLITLDNVVPQYGRDGIGKYIERHYEWFTWQWYSSWRYSYAYGAKNGLQLAVEADWISCYPDDLLYLWADMVEYQSNPTSNIKSESVDGHSWTKGDITPPEKHENNKLLLQRYAGPHGSVVRNPVP